MQTDVLKKSVLQVLTILGTIALTLSGFLYSVNLGFVTSGTIIFLLLVKRVYNHNISLKFETEANTILLKSEQLKAEYLDLYHSGSSDPADKLKLKGIEAELMEMQKQAEALVAESKKHLL